MASSRFAALLPPSARRFIFWELMEMMAISLMAKEGIDEDQHKDEHDTGPYVHMEKIDLFLQWAVRPHRCAAYGCVACTAPSPGFAAPLHTGSN